MLAWSPQTSTRQPDLDPGARAATSTPPPSIRGLSLTHLNGVGCSGANGDIPIMPYVGDRGHLADGRHHRRQVRQHRSRTPTRRPVPATTGSGWTAAPAAELTATPRTGAGRFTFPADKPASLLLRTVQLGVRQHRRDRPHRPATRTRSPARSAPATSAARRATEQPPRPTTRCTSPPLRPAVRGDRHLERRHAHPGHARRTRRHRLQQHRAGRSPARAPAATSRSRPAPRRSAPGGHRVRGVWPTPSQPPRWRTPGRFGFDQSRERPRPLERRALSTVEIGGGTADQLTTSTPRSTTPCSSPR